MARRRWWASGVLAVVLAVLVAILARQVLADDADDSRVFVIGDSITVMAGAEALGPDGWDVDARAGRTTPEGIEVAAESDLSDTPVVIVALGTNDHLDDAATYGRRIDQMLAAIGPGPRVIWINVDAQTAELAGAKGGVNAALAAATARHANLRVADWDAYISSLPDTAGLRAGDGIHYSQEGSDLRRAWTVQLVEG